MRLRIVLPSGRTSRVERIVTYDGDLDVAHAPLSVTLTLEDELDISRGDLLTLAGEEAQVARRFAASLVWMDGRSLDTSRRYLLKHASQTVPAEVRLRHRVDLEQSIREPGRVLEMNNIGVAEIETRRPGAARCRTRSSMPTPCPNRQASRKPSCARTQPTITASWASTSFHPSPSGQRRRRTWRSRHLSRARTSARPRSADGTAR